MPSFMPPSRSPRPAASQADAEAYATGVVAQAIKENGLEAAQYQVALKQVEALTALGKGAGQADRSSAGPCDRGLRRRVQDAEGARADVVAAWWVWMAAALVLAIVEVLLPGFMLLGFAIGAAVVRACCCCGRRRCSPGRCRCCC